METAPSITWVAFLDSCREHGVRVRAVSHSRTYDPREGRDYETLAEDGVSSAYEADLISERVLRGQGESAAEGKPHSRTAYRLPKVLRPEDEGIQPPRTAPRSGTCSERHHRIHRRRRAAATESCSASTPPES